MPPCQNTIFSKIKKKNQPARLLAAWPHGYMPPLTCSSPAPARVFPDSSNTGSLNGQRRTGGSIEAVGQSHAAYMLLSGYGYRRGVPSRPFIQFLLLLLLVLSLGLQCDVAHTVTRWLNRFTTQGNNWVIWLACENRVCEVGHLKSLFWFIGDIS